MSVVRKMVEVGVRVGEDLKLYVGDLELDDTALASSVGVDRRVVRSTVEDIVKDKELGKIFSAIRPAGASLVDIAGFLGHSVLVISADAQKPGVISGVTAVLSRHRIVIMQALADDPYLTSDPKLTLVVKGKVPPEALSQIQGLDVVKSLTVKK